ncbi:hypothetical protein B0H10DRAFT_1968373 [Mycena sp. CBHHK59/15]|nr:hypothetical protein B0H10DRAFT_1968373 [Mycena sp. CBHHK59/15]
MIQQNQQPRLDLTPFSSGISGKMVQFRKIMSYSANQCVAKGQSVNWKKASSESERLFKRGAACPISKEGRLDIWGMFLGPSAQRPGFYIIIQLEGAKMGSTNNTSCGYTAIRGPLLSRVLCDGNIIVRSIATGWNEHLIHWNYGNLITYVSQLGMIPTKSRPKLVEDALPSLMHLVRLGPLTHTIGGRADSVRREAVGIDSVVNIVRAEDHMGLQHGESVKRSIPIVCKVVSRVSKPLHKTSAIANVMVAVPGI